MTAPSAPASASGSFAPFRRRVFAALWTATLLSNVGTWMHDVAAGWLMTSLTPSAFVVSAVQAATTAAMALFALPAGALADLVDRRRLLVGLVLTKFALALALAALTWLGRVEVWSLLAVTFALGVCSALMAPAWQSIVPTLVPRTELKQAVALNSMGINVARALGPGVGGYIVVKAGAAAAFFVNALSELVIAAALWFWKPAPAPARRPERFVPAMAAGLRFAASAPALRKVLWRAGAFFPFASAYWALLPLVARETLAGDARLFGALVAAIGAGAVAGALLLPRADRRLGAEGLLAAGSLGTASAMSVFALSTSPVAALGAGALAGASWIFVLSTLNVAAQNALPDWVRGRGLSIFGLTFFGAMTIGALFWGAVAGVAGVPVALIGAAIGMTLALAAARRTPLAPGVADLAPSGHWPDPPVAIEPADARGPVMVQIEYRVQAGDRAAFVAALDALSDERRRDGAYFWEAFEDVADPGRWVEVFVEESWGAHMRHHARVTKSDADLQATVAALHSGPAPPKVTHLLAPETK